MQRADQSSQSTTSREAPHRLMIQSWDHKEFFKEPEGTEAERKDGRTYLNLTIVTVSEATLFPTSFAPLSILDQTVEKPGMMTRTYCIFESLKWIKQCWRSKSSTSGITGCCKAGSIQRPLLTLYAAGCHKLCSIQIGRLTVFALFQGLWHQLGTVFLYMGRHLLSDMTSHCGNTIYCKRKQSNNLQRLHASNCHMVEKQFAFWDLWYLHHCFFFLLYPRTGWLGQRPLWRV